MHTIGSVGMCMCVCRGDCSDEGGDGGFSPSDCRPLSFTYQHSMQMYRFGCFGLVAENFQIEWKINEKKTPHTEMHLIQKKGISQLPGHSMANGMVSEWQNAVIRLIE